MAAASAASTAGTATGHALKTSWVIWEERSYGDKIEGEKWANLLLPIAEFSTVEEFWRLWTFLPKLSEVFSGHIGPSKLKRMEGEPKAERIAGAAGFMIFRKGIQPQAEDTDAAGVKHTSKRFRSDRNTVKNASDVLNWEQAWETIVLLLIGESLPDAASINGAYIMDKTKGRNVSYRLEIWTKEVLSTSTSRQISEALIKVKPKPFSIKA